MLEFTEYKSHDDADTGSRITTKRCRRRHKGLPSHLKLTPNNTSRKYFHLITMQKPRADRPRRRDALLFCWLLTVDVNVRGTRYEYFPQALSFNPGGHSSRGAESELNKCNAGQGSGTRSWDLSGSSGEGEGEDVSVHVKGSV
jgi:hypothetical protein